MLARLFNLALVGNILLTSKRKIIADNALTAYWYQIPSPAVKFSGSKNKLVYTLTGHDASNSNVVMNYMLTFREKKLSIVGTGNVGNTPVSISVIGKRRGH